MYNDKPPIRERETYQAALAQTQTLWVAVRSGCLWGIGLLILFALISGGVYLAGGAFGLSERWQLLVSVASGPICGTFLVVLLFYSRGMKAQRELLRTTDLSSLKKVPEEDETTSGYTS